jgi:ketosteroid isomerase-like protein
MTSKSDPTIEISAAQRRFLHLFAMNDPAGIAACYTEDAQMLVANMDVIRGRAAIESVFKFTAVRGHTLRSRQIHGGLEARRRPVANSSRHVQYECA